mmetsp:Transcript_31674/g.35999  ORF Transcript_31674/g.35999 Transcript_31674/m.35999 type:complete len:132 (+) Transcript_31674:181-576(+)
MMPRYPNNGNQHELYGNRNRNVNGNGNGSNNLTLEKTMKDQTDEYISELADQAEKVKFISLGISEGLDEDSKELSKMKTTYDKSSDLLGKTMKKLDNVLDSKQGRMTLYICFFVFFVFLILYKLTRNSSDM